MAPAFQVVTRVSAWLRVLDTRRVDGSTHPGYEIAHEDEAHHAPHTSHRQVHNSRKHESDTNFLAFAPFFLLPCSPSAALPENRVAKSS